MSNKVIVNGVDMIELIERDKPIKPKKTYFTTDEITQYNCSVCNSRVDIPQLIQVNFCPKCGQRLDWGE